MMWVLIFIFQPACDDAWCVSSQQGNRLASTSCRSYALVLLGYLLRVHAMA